MIKTDMRRSGERRRNLSGARSRIILGLGIVVALSALFADSAKPDQKIEHSFVQIVSPGVRGITIPDTANLNDVLQILRSEGATFDGPDPVVVYEEGESRIIANKITIRVYPRDRPDPACPYQQKTELIYNLEGKLYDYAVFYFPLCVK